jgi:hypothetical protein
VSAGAAKFLVIARVGRSSLHHGWLQGTPDFDLLLCPYQEIEPTPGALRTTAVMPGQKWDGIYKLLTEWGGWRDYDYIWLPDDDLETDAATLNMMFALSKAWNVKISAPALAEDSFFSHRTTMRNRSFFARAVAFLEVMMPCFRRDALEACLPSIAMCHAGYGWGLDMAWPMIVGYEGMVIFDALPVRHTRAVGSVRDAAHAAQGHSEWEAVMARYTATLDYRVRGAYAANGAFRLADLGLFLMEYLEGYRYLIEREADFLLWYVDVQKIVLPMPAVPEVTGDVLLAVNGFRSAVDGAPIWQVDLGHVYDVTGLSLRSAEQPKFSLEGAVAGDDFTIQAVKLDDGSLADFVCPPFRARFLKMALIGDGVLAFDEIKVQGVRAR